MTEPGMETKQKTGIKQNSLKGTFISVMILGGLIVVSWFAMFALFLSRQ